MLKQIEEEGIYVEITAFRNAGTIKLEDLLKVAVGKKTQNVWVQFFDAGLVATWQHMYFAVLNAVTAFKNKRNISKNLAMEVMLYASAQRQIRKAIALIGVKPTSENVAAVIIGYDLDAVKKVLSAITNAVGVAPDEGVLELSAEKARRIREAFLISEKELDTVKEKDDVEQALVKLVIERVALLATRL